MPVEILLGNLKLDSVAYPIKLKFFNVMCQLQPMPEFVNRNWEVS